MNANLDNLLHRLWTDYTTINPQARQVHDLLTSRGEKVINDHIAFRTFDDPRVNIARLEKAFFQLGYRPCGDYKFEQKKLTARHYEYDPGHSSGSGANAELHRPKIFLSQFELDRCSPFLSQAIRVLLGQLPPQAPDAWDFCISGRNWNLSVQTYEALAGESEYASWVAAWGFRANHFTVDVGGLRGFVSLQAFNDWVRSQGFTLNASGGLIKGSPAELLEQSSTLADLIEVHFADGVRKVPACYYEFAKRYPDAEGKLFQGFIAKSADKIFESTHRQAR